MSEWLEQELARELAPVDAPGDLWLRIRIGGDRAPKRKPSAFLMAAAAMFLVAAGAFWLWGNPARSSGPQTASQGTCYTCHTSL